MLDRVEFISDARCPLNGVRILGLSRVVAGNALSVASADLEAEVSKVETSGTLKKMEFAPEVLLTANLDETERAMLLTLGDPV